MEVGMIQFEEDGKGEVLIRRSQSNRLGKTRRVMAAGVIGFGIFTFFEPLIGTNPAVMGNVKWSVLDVFRQFGDGKLLREAGSFALSAGLIYFVMLTALVGVFVFPSQKLLGAAGMIGAIVTYLAWRFDRIDLEVMFYGSIQDFRAPRFGIIGTGRGVNLNSLMLILGGVMLVLVFISRNRSLDG
jgi:hypothetical protein